MMENTNQFVNDKPLPQTAMDRVDEKIEETMTRDSILVLVKEKKSAFLVSVALLIALVVANVLYYLYNPEALYNVFLVICAINLVLFSLVVYFRQKTKVVIKKQKRNPLHRPEKPHKIVA